MKKGMSHWREDLLLLSLWLRHTQISSLRNRNWLRDKNRKIHPGPIFLPSIVASSLKGNFSTSNFTIVSRGKEYRWLSLSKIATQFRTDLVQTVIFVVLCVLCLEECSVWGPLSNVGEIQWIKYEPCSKGVRNLRQKIETWINNSNSRQILICALKEVQRKP